MGFSHDSTMIFLWFSDLPLRGPSPKIFHPRLQRLPAMDGICQVAQFMEFVFTEFRCGTQGLSLVPEYIWVPGWEGWVIINGNMTEYGNTINMVNHQGPWEFPHPCNWRFPWRYVRTIRLAMSWGFWKIPLTFGPIFRFLKWPLRQGNTPRIRSIIHHWFLFKWFLTTQSSCDYELWWYMTRGIHQWYIHQWVSTSQWYSKYTAAIHQTTCQ